MIKNDAERREHMKQASQILLAEDIDPTTCYEQLRALKGFGFNLASGLTMMFSGLISR